jgi:aspartyl-tRNA(Asn)/glutamyl-tRNA(Gln) amidotransferase subunit C
VYDFPMPTDFTPDDVRRVAKLANLELDETEVAMFARQLGQVLAYAKELDQIDTRNVAPTARVGQQSADRPDDTRPSLDRAAALALAPDPAPAAGLFRVPRVIG